MREKSWGCSERKWYEKEKFTCDRIAYKYGLGSVPEPRVGESIERKGNKKMRT